MAGQVEASVGKLQVERLCGHHRVDDFRSSDETMNGNLRAYHANLEHGEETVVFAAVADSVVYGFIAICDLKPLDNDRVQAPYLFIPSIAVDTRATHRNVATRLSRKVVSVASRRVELGQREYAGFLAIDYNDEVHRLLRAAKFQHLNGLFWWRPFPDPR